jgi:two-component system response regulator HydG
VHEASPRAAGPLVVVDCASLPETLFESELFGHERAPSPAPRPQAGLVEAASGGTLFLDEVGDIPLPMQVKLLRLLEAAPTAAWAAPSCGAPMCAWWRPPTAT